MSPGPRAALQAARAGRAELVRAVARFVAIPSVSADPRRAGDVRCAADQLAQHLQAVGLGRVRVLPTGGHPAVVANWHTGPQVPTVLLYGHYDVQPAGPTSAWTAPPFGGVVRGDRLFGRGASDDKGQLLAQVAAVGAWLRATGRLPVNLVCLFDGEEEIGSPHLPEVLRRHRAALAADVAVVSDTRMLGPDRPVITTALRGSVVARVEVRGPARALHSGAFGGAVTNPATALCRMVAALHAAEGRVVVPGFHRRVRPPRAGVRAALAAADPDLLLARAGVRTGWGEPGFTPAERATLRPAVDVLGITAGPRGPGRRSAIPSRATATLGVRLVADQRPVEVAALLVDHLRRHTPPGVRAALRFPVLTPPVAVDVQHPALAAAVRACRPVFGRDPALLPSGGTIPAVGHLRTALGVETVLLGFGLPEDAAHGPDESVHLPTLFRAVDTCVRLLHELGSLAVDPWGRHRVARPVPAA
jgi:acetylornithine deacetylase/succinyl-diaminopimelate desuccinylase-like protein